MELLAGRAIDHRDRGGGLAKLQLEDREAIQRRIGDPDALAPEQFANLRQPEPIGQPAPNRLSLRLTLRPPVTARASANRLQREQHLADLVVADGRAVCPQTRCDGDAEIPPDGLGIEPELRGKPFRRHALAPQAQHFLDFKHRDLAIHLASWPEVSVPGGDVVRAVRRGGKGFEKPCPGRGEWF